MYMFEELLNLTCQVYFVENENLVVITVEETKSQVDSNLDQIKRWVLDLYAPLTTL